jgi:hypothetical protein
VWIDTPKENMANLPSPKTDLIAHMKKNNFHTKLWRTKIERSTKQNVANLLPPKMTDLIANVNNDNINVRPNTFNNSIYRRCRLNPTEIGAFDSVQTSQQFWLKS